MSYNNAQRATIPMGTKKMFGLSKIRTAFDNALYSTFGIRTERKRQIAAINRAKYILERNFYVLHPELEPAPLVSPTREDLARMPAKEWGEAMWEARLDRWFHKEIAEKRKELTRDNHQGTSPPPRAILG